MTKKEVKKKDKPKKADVAKKEDNDRTRTPYDSFIESFENLSAVQRLGSHEARDSDDPRERLSRIDYAINYAAQTPGLQDIVEDEHRNDPYQIDTYLSLAQEQFAKERAGIFKDNREGIIRATPDEGLAKIVYSVLPAEKKDDDGHNEIAELHRKYTELGEMIEGVRNPEAKKKVEYSTLLDKVMKYEKERINKGFEENRYLAGDDDFKNKVYSVVQRALSNPNEGLRIAMNMRGNIAEELESKLDSDEKKARYTRDNLLANKKDEEVMYAVYIANQAAKKKAA